MRYDIDCRFMVAKFMHFYSYRWEEIMEKNRLPFSVFIELYFMIDRVLADKALEIDIPVEIVKMTGNTEALEHKMGKTYTMIISEMSNADREKDRREANWHFNNIRKTKHKAFERMKENNHGLRNNASKDRS